MSPSSHTAYRRRGVAYATACALPVLALPVLLATQNPARAGQDISLIVAGRIVDDSGRAIPHAHIDGSTPEHDAYARWVTRMATGPEPFALSVLVLSGFVRIVTNARVFDPPSTLDEAFAFVSSLTERPNARIVGHGPDHMAIFEHLCRAAGATGKLVADAQHAAVAMEHGCTMVSTDSDFARFPALRWQHPLGDEGPVSDGDVALRDDGRSTGPRRTGSSTSPWTSPRRKVASVWHSRTSRTPTTSTIS